MNFEASLARKTMAPYTYEMRDFVRSPLPSSCMLTVKSSGCANWSSVNASPNTCRGIGTYPSHRRKPLPSLLELRCPVQNCFREFRESITRARVALRPSDV